MATTQPKSTVAAQFFIHLLISFVVGVLAAIFTALVQYIATSGASINPSYILTVSGVAFTAFVAAFFKQHIQPNEPEIIQGIEDTLTELHIPLLAQLTQLSQQVAALQASSVPVASVPPTSATTSPQGTQSFNPDVTMPIAAIQTAQQAQVK